MKNPNGFGTIYKLPGRRRKPWVARVTTGWELVANEESGEEKERQLRQIIGYFENKKDALNALALHRVNPVSPKADITLAKLYEEWSKGKYEYISKATINNYKAGWNYLAKYEKAKMKDLRTAHLQAVIDSGHKAGLSRSSLQKIKVVATMLFNYAIQNDILSKNYAEFIKLPKAEKEEKRTFTDLEIQKLEKAQDTPWVDTILILIYTGMRINEMLGLSRFNVDLDKQIITGGLKTDAGKNRIIPIHPKIYAHIKKWYDKGGEYLICHKEGKRILDKYYREKYYYPTLDRLNIRRLNPHCCRHTWATLMARAGVDPRLIKTMIGHSKYSFTADIYTHTNIAELKEAIGKI